VKHETKYYVKRLSNTQSTPEYVAIRYIPPIEGPDEIVPDESISFSIEGVEGVAV